MIDLRVKVSPTGVYTYPDIVALCGEAQREAESDSLTARHPSGKLGKSTESAEQQRIE